eukprot:6263379-Pyramimonas_sp.AAC.1
MEFAVQLANPNPALAGCGQDRALRHAPSVYISPRACSSKRATFNVPAAAAIAARHWRQPRFGCHASSPGPR